MPYITNTERLARAEGRLESRLADIEDALRIRFGDSAYEFFQELGAIQDPTKLRTVFRGILSGQSLEELRALIHPPE